MEKAGPVCRVTFLFSLLLLVTIRLDAQTVSNVRLQQLTTGTHPFEILYDLTGAPDGGAAVSVAFGTSSGGPFTIIPQADELSGDVGNGVTNGTNRRIVWSAAPGLCSALYAAVTVLECSFTLSPASASYGASGGTGQFTITASSGTCPRTATSNATWLTITSGASSTGSGTVTYSVAANTGAGRTGTITAGGQTFTVNQAEASAAPQEITITLPGNVPLVLVEIPKGTFWMGSPETERNRGSDETRHEVTLTQDYYMGKYEVTQGQWQAVMGTAMRTDCGSYGIGADYPVYCVSWNDIAGSGGFLEKLNAHLTATGQAGAGKLRLPTEAEWERAARAGTDTRFSFGDALSGADDCGANAEANPYVWWCNNSGSGIHEVGTKSPNGYGLYDMHGNLYEWVQDWYGGYGSGAQTDPAGPVSGSFRVGRGGNWNFNLQGCRSAYRYFSGPGGRSDLIGFRLSMVANACIYSLTPSSASTSAAGGQGSFALTTTSGCSWSASSNATWLTITSGASSTGSGTVTYSVAANTGAGRTGTITAGGQTFTVNQAEASAAPQEITITLPGNVPLVLVEIPKGTFWMGSPETERNRGSDETRHEVTLTQDYYMGKYEVTQGQWQAVMGSNPSGSCGNVGIGSNYPVYCVSWNDIAGTGGFLEKLNAHMTATGQAGAGKFRLPTEAEWERAARAGTDTRFSFGDALSGDDGCGANAEANPYVWWCNNSGSGIHEVGTKSPNGYGLHDMHGNLWEWVQDWYGSYGSGAETDPTGPASGSFRVLRGGGWYYYLQFCRSAARGPGDFPGGRYSGFGFRLSRPADDCNYSLTPSSASTSAAGGQGSFALTTTSGCSWSASSNATWLTITSGASGTGSGTVTYSVAANTGAARTGTITAGGQTFTVNQAEASAAPQEITITLPGNVPLVLVEIPKGTFWMGSPETERNRGSDETRHEVTLTQDYFMGKYEVTQGQWQAVMESNPSGDCGSYGIGADYPVYCVSWNDIAGPGGFLEKLNAHLTATGQAGAGKFRLPTEAEWERAARAGTDTRFSFGDALSGADDCGANSEANPYVWWCNNSGNKSHEVGTKSPNGYGLYDMHGNLWEWVQDWYGNYSSGAQTDPTGAASGSERVVRGSSWAYHFGYSRSAKRDVITTDYGSRRFCTGFRLSMVADDCTYSLTPSLASTSAPGGQGSFALTTTSGCSWLASSNATWLTITSGASGTGSGTVSYSVAANTGAGRTGTITVGGKTFTVNQAEASAAPQEITITLPGNVPLVLVKIPAGTFQMGSPDSERGRGFDEVLVHQVTLTSDYYMGKYEVTQGQWQAVMGSAMRTECGNGGIGASYPVYCVSWDDIAGSGGFLEKLNAHLTATGQAGAGKYKIPAEAQWERAARAGTQTRFSFGDALGGDDDCGANSEANGYVWWCNDSGSGSHDVGTKSPNGYGLYDMHGNVWEWVQDWYGAYGSGAQTDPAGPASGSRRVLRGGFWYTSLRFCRSAVRNSDSPGYRHYGIGFRLSRLP